MKNSTILHDISPDDLSIIVRETVQKELAEFKKSFEPNQPEEYLTRAEVAKMLKCDETTVYNWVKKGKLVRYCIGNRTYYLLSEIKSALKKI